jgi:hypothetical protein
MWKSLAVVIAAAASASAGTIVSITGPASNIAYSIDSMDYIAISWTQTSSYAGVSISTELVGGGSGIAYLATAIGPGSTPANQVASDVFNFPGSVTNLTLFSGLSLGPGTYYLLLTGTTAPNQPSGWEITYSPTFTTDSGVTRLVGLDFSSDSGATYSYYPFDNNSGPIYSVTGTLVTSESGTGALVSVVLGAMLLGIGARKTIAG